MNMHAMPPADAGARPPRSGPRQVSPQQIWTDAEKDFVRANWGFYLPHEWPEKLPGRTYAAVKNLALHQKLKASDNDARRRATYGKGSGDEHWTPAEIAILRTRSRSEATRLLAPRRSATAVAAKAEKLKLFAYKPERRWTAAENEILTTNPLPLACTLLAPRRTRAAVLGQATKLGLRTRARPRWSPDEIRALFENGRDAARALLAPKRTSKAIAEMAKRLDLKEPAGRPFDGTEMALLRNIVRCVDVLREKHGRSALAIAKRADRERRIQRFSAEAVAAVKAACAGLDPAVRLDVEGEVLVAVLSRKVDLAGIPAEIRAARTRMYGPRHYSLDAPIGDGSTRWIDTIADDREHF